MLIRQEQDDVVLTPKSGRAIGVVLGVGLVLAGVLLCAASFGPYGRGVLAF